MNNLEGVPHFTAKPPSFARFAVPYLNVAALVDDWWSAGDRHQRPSKAATSVAPVPTDENLSIGDGQAGGAHLGQELFVPGVNRGFAPQDCLVGWDDDNIFRH